MQGPCSCWCAEATPRPWVPGCGSSGAGFRGEAPNVDATGHAVAAHPTGVRLVRCREAERPSSWCRARKPDRVSNRRTVWSGVERAGTPFRRVHGDGIPLLVGVGGAKAPERVSNRRRVGLVSRGQERPFVGGAGGREGPLFWRDATGGRSASLAMLSGAAAWRGATAPNLLLCCTAISPSARFIWGTD
jgi:hypothetical protein